MSKRYTIRATFKVERELIVKVPDDADPHDEKSWEDIEDEFDLDCWLYDVEDDSAKEMEDGL